MISWRWLAAFTAIAGLSAVVLAALGAHLVPLESSKAQASWQSALQIHMFHNAVLVGVLALSVRVQSSLLAGGGILFSGWIMAAGVLLFSGSLYLRAAGLDVLSPKLAPLGGMALILAWVCLGISLIACKPNHQHSK